MRPLFLLLTLAASGAAVQAQDTSQPARVLVAEAYDVLLGGTTYGFAFEVVTTTPDTTLRDVGQALAALDPETTGSQFVVTFEDAEIEVAMLNQETYSVLMPRTETVYVDSTRSEMASGPMGLLMLHPAFGAALYSIAGDARAQIVGRDSVAGAPCTRATYVLTLDAAGNELGLDVCFGDDGGLPLEIMYRDSGGITARMTFAAYEALGPASEFDADPVALAAEIGWRLAPYDSSDLPLLEVGAAAPAFALLDTDGETVRLEDFTGQTVLVDFWGTWCAPCVAAIPHIQEIAETYPDLVVLGLASYEEPDADPAAFVAQRGGRYPILIADRETIDAWRVHAFPTYLVIDPDGTVAFVAVEGRDPDAQAALDAFLAQRLARPTD